MLLVFHFCPFSLSIILSRYIYVVILLAGQFVYPLTSWLIFKLFTIYGLLWIECVHLLKFLHWNHIPQCDNNNKIIILSLLESRLWKLIRSWGWSSHDRISAFIQRQKRTCSLPSIYIHTYIHMHIHIYIFTVWRYNKV